MIRAFCWKVIQFVIGAAVAIEADRFVDLKTLQLPVAILIAVLAIGALFPKPRGSEWVR
jgi:hypothetical protein